MALISSISAGLTLAILLMGTSASADGKELPKARGSVLIEATSCQVFPNPKVYAKNEAPSKPKYDPQTGKLTISNPRQDSNIGDVRQHCTTSSASATATAVFFDPERENTLIVSGKEDSFLVAFKSARDAQKAKQIFEAETFEIAAHLNIAFTERTAYSQNPLRYAGLGALWVMLAPLSCASEEGCIKGSEVVSDMKGPGHTKRTYMSPPTFSVVNVARSESDMAYFARYNALLILSPKVLSVRSKSNLSWKSLAELIKSYN